MPDEGNGRWEPALRQWRCAISPAMVSGGEGGHGHEASATSRTLQHCLKKSCQDSSLCPIKMHLLLCHLLHGRHADNHASAQEDT